jgi:hypothetical protein
MATLRQDVWFGESPRLSGLRLGPFREAPGRVLLHPHRAAAAISPRLMSFAERLAERVEVVLLNPRPVPSGPDVVTQQRDDLVSVVQCLTQRWNDRVPLVLAGIGLGGALALSLAGEPAVRAAAALAPFVPAQAPWPAAADAGVTSTFDPPSLDKPVLIIAPRDDQHLDRPRLESAVARWPQATWIAPPGPASAALAPAWAGTLAEWALAALAG